MLDFCRQLCVDADYIDPRAVFGIHFMCCYRIEQLIQVLRHMLDYGCHIVKINSTTTAGVCCVGEYWGVAIMVIGMSATYSEDMKQDLTAQGATWIECFQRPFSVQLFLLEVSVQDCVTWLMRGSAII